MRKLSKEHEAVYLKLMDMFPEKRPQELVKVLDGDSMAVIRFVDDEHYRKAFYTIKYTNGYLIIALYHAGPKAKSWEEETRYRYFDGVLEEVN